MIEYAFSLAQLEYFLLILVRITMFVHVAPFFGLGGSPWRVRIGLSLFVSALLYYVYPMQEPIVYETVFGYAVIVLKEAATGALIGLGASVCTTIVSFAGRIMDMEAGLSMVNLMDPATNQSSSISGMIYHYALMLMMMISGMHRYFLMALAETYELIPVNGAVFDVDGMLAAMIDFLAQYILIGFRICLPMFAIMILLNAILGILAKVAPQMNMFAVGIQFKVLTGIFVLFFTTSMMPLMADMIFTEMKRMMVSFVETMM